MALWERTGRRFELSLLNVLLCGLVIWIHVSAQPVSTLGKDSWQYLLVLIPWRLASFAVQGFLFLSGLKLFLTRSEGIRYGAFYLDRLRRIVVPYFCWVVVYYLYFMRNGYFSFHLPDLLSYLVTGRLVSHFYFIVVLVQFYLLAPVWFSLVKRASAVLIIPFALLITVIVGQHLPGILQMVWEGSSFPYTDRVFPTYLIYWLAGCYAGRHYDAFQRALRQSCGAITVTFLAAASLNAAMSYLQFSGRRMIPWLENLHILYCMSAILFGSLLCLRVEEKAFPRLRRCIRGLDKLTFSVYFVHCLVIFCCDGLVARLGITSTALRYGIRILAAYSVSICGAALYHKAKSGLVALRSTRRD